MLQALHDCGVVHRDVKPANILVRPDHSPVLVDFGIAYLPKASAAEPLLGTIEYMAPEQALGRRVDGRADLYALGVVAYEWLCGVRPLRLRGRDWNEMARDLAARTAPPISSFRPSVVPELEGFVAALLAKKPRHRPANGARVAQMCREIRHDRLLERPSK